MTTMYKISPRQLIKAAERTLKAGMVPYVHGSPGIGKSDIWKQIADKYNLFIIDARLSQMTPEDIQGLAARDGQKATFLPFDIFPIHSDPLPVDPVTGHEYDGWFIIIDELSSASKAIQAAAYKLILDREVGQHKLHTNVWIAAAGNKASDKAVVIQQSTALQSRMTHYELQVSNADWMIWATKNNVDARIRAFIEYKPSMLHRFDPNHKDLTFPCPRTWEFVHRHINDRAELDDIDMFNIAGDIADGAATEFVNFVKITTNIPKIEDIFRNPMGTEVPQEVTLKFFTITSLSDHTDGDNLEKAIQYINRFPEEMQVIFFRTLLIRNEKLRTHQAFLAQAKKLLYFLES